MKVKKRNKNRVKEQRGEVVFHEYPAISFQHITTNNSFSLKPLDKDVHIKDEFLKACFKLLRESYKSLFSKPKEVGLESIEYFRLRFQPDGLHLRNDDKVCVYRFDSGTKRIIGYKSGEIFYIIGIDYNYSAYSH